MNLIDLLRELQKLHKILRVSKCSFPCPSVTFPEVRKPRKSLKLTAISVISWVLFILQFIMSNSHLLIHGKAMKTSSGKPHLIRVRSH